MSASRCRLVSCYQIWRGLWPCEYWWVKFISYSYCWLPAHLPHAGTDQLLTSDINPSVVTSTFGWHYWQSFCGTGMKILTLESLASDDDLHFAAQTLTNTVIAHYVVSVVLHCVVPQEWWTEILFLKEEEVWPQLWVGEGCMGKGVNPGTWLGCVGVVCGGGKSGHIIIILCLSNVDCAGWLRVGTRILFCIAGTA